MDWITNLNFGLIDKILLESVSSVVEGLCV